MTRLLTTASLASALLAVAGSSAPVPAQPASKDPGLERLEKRVAALAELAGGVVGVGLIHVESGRSLYFNPRVAFPTASTRKLPIAVELMMQVNEGKLKLDSMVSLEPGQIHPASGIIPERLTAPGVSLSLYNHLRLMLEVSDGTATSAILRAVGGPPVVTNRMNALGLRGIVIARETDRIMADYEGLDTLPTPGPRYRERFDEMVAALPEAVRERAHQAFYRDSREMATPFDMAQLIAKLWRGELMTPDRSKLLLEIMYNCQTGANRIRGLLPRGTRVAEKTGQLGETTNDVGIIDLPDGAGHLVAAIYVMLSKVPEPMRERAIAEISRTAYDYFTFNR